MRDRAPWPGSVGLVHDYLLVLRGAERTFAEMARCWPAAPIHTLLYDAEGTHGRFSDRDVYSSYLQRTGVRQSGFRRLLPLFPSAVKSLRTDEHDLLVSSSSAFAHGVPSRPDAVHVCYCHTPFRYAYHARDQAMAEIPMALRPALKLVLARTREWDLAAARRVTHYIANSRVTQLRIRGRYGRHAPIVHPPVNVERFHLDEPEDYFLAVTEIVRHKRIEVALAAAEEAGVPLRVVGTGPDLERLRARFPRAEFLGRVDDATLTDLYARCRAFVLPNVEEFGIAAVEAQAAGRPVLAANGGGARETVLDGATGRLVPVHDVRALARAMRELDEDDFDPLEIREHAMRFSGDAFRRQLVETIERLTGRDPGATLPSALPALPRHRAALRVPAVAS